MPFWIRYLTSVTFLLKISILYTLQVSIHSVWLGNNITPLREEEWGEDEEDEADAPAPASPQLSPINSRSDFYKVTSRTALWNQHPPDFTPCIVCLLVLSRKHRAGVDIHSCSQFLLELYSQWILPGSPSSKKTPVVLLSEVVRSVSLCLAFHQPFYAV